MEPALDERGDPSWPGLPTGQKRSPQWSPLSTSGATGYHLDGSGTAVRSRNGARSRRAGRPVRPGSGVRPGRRRNGARSRRAGRQYRQYRRDTAERRPQWSPLSTSGATPGSPDDVAAAAMAAMEPALDERGDAANSSAVMPSSRAAMEPALDERGDAFRRQPAPAAPRRRNGARSRRVGRPAWTSQRPGRTRPQWSPLSTSGATRWTFSTPSMTRGPQWSPLSTSGATTATYGDQPLTMTEPQWSPLSTSGATPLLRGCPALVDGPQWSPLSTSGAT